MSRYQKHIDLSCQRCKEVVASTMNTINRTCFRDPDSCAFISEYNAKFPTEVCSFARNYSRILNSIKQSDTRLGNNHAQNNILNPINPPTGELKECLSRFVRGECCSQSKIDTPKNLSRNQKQYFWEARADGKQNTTPSPPVTTLPPQRALANQTRSSADDIIPDQYHYGNCDKCRGAARKKASECRQKCIKDNTWNDPFGVFGTTKECERKCACNECDALRRCDARPDCQEQIEEQVECVDCDPCEEADKRWKDCCCRNGCHMPPIRCRTLWENGPEPFTDWWGDAGNPQWCSRCMGRAPGVPACPGQEGIPAGRPYRPTDNYEDDYEIPYDSDFWWGEWNPDGPYQGPWPGGGCG